MNVLQRRRGIRVRQRIRRLELWSVFKLALAFHAVCGAISLGVVALLWRLGESAGFTDRFTNFLVDIGFADSIKISGASLFRGATTIAVALVLHNTVVTVLLAVLYNLLSGILGGVIMSVVEDDNVQRVGQKSPRSSARPENLSPRAKQATVSSSAPKKIDRPPRAKPVAAPVPVTTAVERTDDLDDLDDSDWLANLGDSTSDAPYTITPKSRPTSSPTSMSATEQNRN
jgi:hypothetical protein